MNTNEGKNMKKRKAPKCITCGKNLRRNSKFYFDERKPYKGNMICYNKKTIPPVPDDVSDDGKITYIGFPFTRYQYILWDGETYFYFKGRYKFCGVNCAANYGISKLPKHEKPKEFLNKSPSDIYPLQQWQIKGSNL